MLKFLIIAAAIICVVALFATLSAGKEVNNTKNAENKGPRKNIRILLLIYGMTFFVTVLAFGIFILLF